MSFAGDRLMTVRAAAIAALLFFSVGAAQYATAQGVGKPLSENEIREILIWNSPWEGRSTNPPGLYSYRHVFRQRRDGLIADVTSLATNQRSSSVVNIRDGTLRWQDSNGADVNVALGASGELVGTAKSRDTDVPIVLKPRQ
jgi:hypothetical protein